MMRCQRCGKELGSASRCNFCGYSNARDGSVREMSALERNNYTGITIESPFNHEGNYDGSARSRAGFGRESHIHVNQSNIWAQLFGTHIVTRILVALVILMALAFTFFVALPLLTAVLGCAAVWYFVKNVIRRR